MRTANRVRLGWRPRLYGALGSTFVTIGLVLLLFGVYHLYVVPAKTDREQHALEQELDRQWDQPDPAGLPAPVVGNPWETGAPPNGKPLVRLTIPRLNLHWVVVEGVTLADLRRGPGHYPGTAYPGQLGNFAVAGHRAPRVFWDLDQVAAGDPVYVQAGSTVYTYTVTGTEIVRPSDVDVIAPVPDNPAAQPVKQVLTLTTCNPKWASYQRLIVHADLTGVRTVPPDTVVG
ncbi:sortase A [Amycolatopsis sacchari]|uniref:Sortase A n=1 Tax=Amycolatopsis sacchari TaxID=115433 RepID=A0A1I3Q6F7_9PSEU|nr:class E sortase [Amycolatopsis sacchari]SFJ29603.1 sortase A [Amycolatopsis sacchari]